MKRPTMLVKALLQQAALDLDLSVERDLQRVEDRCKHEGLSFLTITLPRLSDALEQGIENGTFTCPTSFSRHGRLPRFLSGFFKRVFDKDGRLLPEVCPETVYWIRQICRFFKKLKKECRPKQNAKAVHHFKAVEGELRMLTSQVERKDNILDKISGIIWAQVFPELDYLSLVCHHGPGFTADRYLPNERYRLAKWYTRSEYSFPSDLHCYPNYGVAAEESRRGAECTEGIEYCRLRDELPVRVVFVPKTQTAPRVIAIEPSNVQYMQQSVKDYIYPILEQNSLTRSSIRFQRQEVNQVLAYRSSIDKRLSTIDLKDASDRVHSHLVRRIFKNSGILDYLEDSRSLHATLPDGSNLVLWKFASMGSALCFPVESMVFYTLIQSAMHQLDGTRPSSRSIRHYGKLIDIYGDDIIIPVEYTDFVIRYLESYALKVNVDKSFSKSNFRESCGADFFNGYPVNPVYARQEPHDADNSWGPEHVMAWNATADLFYLTGKWHVAQVIRDLLRRVVRSTIPRARSMGSGLAHLSLLFTTHLRYNKDTCGFKQKRLHYQPVKRKDDIDGNEIACLNMWGIKSYLRSRGEREFANDQDTCQRLLRRCLESRLESNPTHSSSSGSDVKHDSRTLCNESVPPLPEVEEELSSESSFLQPMARDGTDSCAGETRPGLTPQFDLDYCLVEPVESDPLRYLEGDTNGLDFQTSVKRGDFKSIRRWVSLVG